MPRHDSDSDDSYRSRSRRKKSKKKSRKSSSSSLSTRSSSSEAAKPRQYARSHSRERSKHRHKSSRTKHRRRSHTSSSDSRSRSRKHSRKERSRRSSSRSRSRGRSSKTSKESHSSSPRKSRVKESSYKKERDLEGNAKKAPEEDTLRDKLEAALKAAAVADAQLRQKGLLPDSTQKTAAPSAQQQLKRAQVIDEINSDSFTQKEFLSSRTWGSKIPKLPSQNPATEEAETTKNGSLPSDDDWRTNPEKLIHPSWFEDPQVKMERWKKKLAAMRAARYNSNDIKKDI